MFFERAKVGLNHWWRYILGILIILFGWQIIGAILGPGILLLITSLKEGNISRDLVQSALSVGIDKNLILTFMLLMFVFALISVYIVVRFLHKKPFLSVLTARSKFSWKRAGFGFIVWFIIGLLMFFIGYLLDPTDLVYTFNLHTFIPLVFICLLLLPIQTSFEEVLLRGYAMQGIGIATKSRLLALLIPTVIFGLLHYANPEVEKYGFGIMMIGYMGAGLLFGIIVIMDNGLEMPMGMHLANNLMAATIVSVEGSALPTDPIFTAKNYNPSSDFIGLLISAIIFIFIASKVFKWSNWGKILQSIRS